MTQENVSIVKHSGETTLFDIEKLERSLMNAGASEHTAEIISNEVSEDLYDGITTHLIYKRAHKLLRRHEKSKASRYGLKKAILELGPTGYPFEMFIGELMRHEGFKAEVGNIMQGRCVTHEVDVLAYDESTVRMIECKFHNRLGYKTDVKVPMYIKSRFEDLSAMWQNDSAYGGKKHEGWVVTNARFTQDAIDFARCSGLHVISWDYPNGHSLKNLITKHSLFPITTLSKLSKAHKETLLNAGVTLAKTLCETPERLKEYGIDEVKLQKITLEAQMVCDI